MKQTAITDTRGRLASITDPARDEPVYLTRRNRPVVAVIDSAQLKKLLEPTNSQTSAPSTPLWEETERLGETPIP